MDFVCAKEHCRPDAATTEGRYGQVNVPTAGIPVRRRAGQHWWAATVFVCVLVAAAPAAFAEPIDISFLSGYVYLDSNKDGSMDPKDWAIEGAVVELLKADDPAFRRQTPTDQFGFYSFERLEPGSYTIRQVTRAVLDGADNLGKLLQVGNDTEILPVDSHGVVGDDMFIDIVIAEQGVRGMWYNFGERIYPIELISKHMLLTTASGFHRVPEPGALWMLAVGGLAIGCLAAWHRRRQKS